MTPVTTLTKANIVQKGKEPGKKGKVRKRKRERTSFNFLW